jgi:hypothetical protein
LTHLAASQTIPWPVAPAELRFELEITSQPSEPCAGVVVLLPDGGLLPRAAPGATVLDAAGNELPNECLWHNPAEGLALVFTPPANGKKVWVYFRSAGMLRSPTATSPFCPSLVLYTQIGKASLDVARQLARENPPGHAARAGLVDRIASTDNPFGPDDSYSSYFTGWLKPTQSGAYYLATISDDGSECTVDGRVVASWPGTHTRD